VDYRAWYGLGQTYELLNMHSYAIYYFRKAVALRYGRRCAMLSFVCLCPSHYHSCTCACRVQTLRFAHVVCHRSMLRNV
jgi:hypothetical protein